jgi:hypothetical protein
MLEASWNTVNSNPVKQDCFLFFHIGICQEVNYDNISVFETVSTLGVPATFIFSRDNVQKDSGASAKDFRYTSTKEW